MRPTAKSRDGETARVVVGVVLTFLGVGLIALSPLVSREGWLGLAAAVTVTLVGLGLLLTVILRHVARSPDS